MLIRVISDLHLDVNKNYPFNLQNNNEFTVICGDISGNPSLSAEWIRNNVKKGVFVCGNHIVYNNLNKTVHQNKQFLSDNFKLDDDITFLDKDVGVFKKEIDDIIFLGSCFYTDYNYGSNDQRSNMLYGSMGLNDYRFGIASINGKIIEDLTPKHYLNWHNQTINCFKEVIEENEKKSNPKKIIIITHHCPSPRCIEEKYKYNKLNSSFVSDYDEFIIKYNSIKAWFCGHVHNQLITKFKHSDGSYCTLICNPRGYICNNEDKNFDPDTYIDTDTWEVKSKINIQ